LETFVVAGGSKGIGLALVDWLRPRASKIVVLESDIQSAGNVDHAETVLIHLGPEWTQAHWDTPEESVIELAIVELFKALSLEPQKPIHASAHRWKYASVSPSEPLQQCFDREAGIAVCGDWTRRSRIDGAFLSGQSAVGTILGSFDESAAKQRIQQLLLFE
jgi:predicted NAD/FAD-dependent oxidoreductase